jgi:hypothetical protein
MNRNFKDIFWEAVFLAVMTYLIFVVASGCRSLCSRQRGCAVTQRPEYFNSKLDNVIKMENQIGAIGLYNSQRLNSHTQIGKPLDGSTKAWMDWYVMNEKLGKNGRNK